MEHGRRMSLERYLELNGKYLRDADELIAKKDFVQASEKFWGATAEIIKAVAAKRGISLGTHRSLGEFITTLQKEHPEWDLIVPYQVANSLHMNFYEDHLPREHVLKAAEVVKDLVAKLRNLA